MKKYIAMLMLCSSVLGFAQDGSNPPKVIYIINDGDSTGSGAQRGCDVVPYIYDAQQPQKQIIGDKIKFSPENTTTVSTVGSVGPYTIEWASQNPSGSGQACYGVTEDVNDGDTVRTSERQSKDCPLSKQGKYVPSSCGNFQK